MALVFFIAHGIGFTIQTSAPENFLVDIVLFLGLIVAAYRYRALLPDGMVMFKELMLLGLWVGGMASLFYGFFLWIYGSFDETIVARFIEARLSLMPEADSEPSAALNIQLVKAYTAGDWGFIGGFRCAVMSILMNFITALLVRTAKAPVRLKHK